MTRRRTYLPSISTLVCSKTEIEPAPRRTYLPSINTLVCSKTEIEPVLENMNLSYQVQNHSSVTRLKQFVHRCQMYDTAESWLPNMIQS